MRIRSSSSALRRKFLLDALRLFASLVFSNLLLLLENALISGVHLEVGLKLRHLDALTVTKGHYIVEGQNQIKCLLQNKLIINVLIAVVHNYLVQLAQDFEVLNDI